MVKETVVCAIASQTSTLTLGTRSSPLTAQMERPAHGLITVQPARINPFGISTALHSLQVLEPKRDGFFFDLETKTFNAAGISATTLPTFATTAALGKLTGAWIVVDRAVFSGLTKRQPLKQPSL